MSDFLFDYGLFTFKAVTLLIFIVIAFAFISSILAAKQKEKESIEIEKLNEHFETLQDALESEILPKHDYKKLLKERKKQAKKDKKSTKKFCKDIDRSEEQKKRVFVVKFEGDLHASEVDNLRKSITAILTVAKAEDEVLLLLESAGGIVHNYGLAASQLCRLREKNIKLTIAVDLIAASGGYMMACIANKIIAAPFAIVGSIGVLAQLPNFNRLLSKLDIDIEHHTAGKHKSTLTMFGKNTPESREKFLAELQDTHNLFKEFVKNYRPQLDVENIATGEHWYGKTALGLNLVDDIKTSDDYLLENAKDKDIYEISYKIQATFREKINTLLYDSVANLCNKLYTKIIKPLTMAS